MLRIVLGYHGTTGAAARAVVRGGALRVSQNRWDWLGDGVYFWEYGPVRAWEWARGRYGDQATVLRADITLEGCLDLVDLRGTRRLKRAFGPFCAMLQSVGAALPRQKGKARSLDRAVINFFASEVEPAIRTVRAAFFEGQPLWKGSGLLEEAHVQIAVRDPQLIGGVTLVEKPEDEQF